MVSWFEGVRKQTQMVFKGTKCLQESFRTYGIYPERHPVIHCRSANMVINKVVISTGERQLNDSASSRKPDCFGKVRALSLADLNVKCVC